MEKKKSAERRSFLYLEKPRIVRGVLAVRLLAARGTAAQGTAARGTAVRAFVFYFLATGTI